MAEFAVTDRQKSTDVFFSSINSCPSVAERRQRGRGFAVGVCCSQCYEYGSCELLYSTCNGYGDLSALGSNYSDIVFTGYGRGTRVSSGSSNCRGPESLPIRK